MSPESSDYMSTAEWSLDQARIVFNAGAHEVAAREAYAAALSAARAIIYEKTGNAPKTHSGTHSQLHSLIHQGMPFDPQLAKFLTEAFEIKQTVDYGPVQKMTRDEAVAYIQNAAAFLQQAQKILAK